MDTHQAVYVTLTHACCFKRSVLFLLFLFIVSWPNEKIISDSSQRVILVLVGGGEGVCLGKQPTESNAFRHAVGVDCTQACRSGWVTAGRYKKAEHNRDVLSVVGSLTHILFGIRWDFWRDWELSVDQHWSVLQLVFCHQRACGRWGNHKLLFCFFLFFLMNKTSLWHKKHAERSDYFCSSWRGVTPTRVAQ